MYRKPSDSNTIIAMATKHHASHVSPAASPVPPVDEDEEEPDDDEDIL